MKFFRRHGELYVATANEAHGTVSVLQVVAHGPANEVCSRSDAKENGRVPR